MRQHTGIWRIVEFYSVSPATGHVCAVFDCGHSKLIGTTRRCGIMSMMQTEMRRCRDCLPKETAK